MAKDEQVIPHIAIVMVTATINKQNEDGTWHPRAVHHDRFMLNVVGETVEECKEELQRRLALVQEIWDKEDKKNADESSSDKTPTNSD